MFFKVIVSCFMGLSAYGLEINGFMQILKMKNQNDFNILENSS